MLLLLRDQLQNPHSATTAPLRGEFLQNEFLRRVRGARGGVYQDEGLIRGRWKVAEDTRRRIKVYELTRAGRRALEREKADWHAYVRAMELLISRT
jgi:hypothetical protein